MNFPSHDLLVSKLYDSVLEQGNLQDFLQSLAQAMHSESAHIRLLDLDTNEVFFSEHYNYNPDLFTEYRRYYINLDIFNQHIRHIPPGKIVRSQDVIADRELLRTELYNDYMRRLGRFNLTGACFLRQGKQSAVVSNLRNKVAGAFTTQETETLKRLTPHLTRAFTIQQRMEQLASKYSALSEGLAQLPYGMIFLDNKGQITEVTARAAQIMQGHPLLTLQHKCLSIRNSELQQQLDAIIQHALSLHQGSKIAPFTRDTLSIPAKADGSGVQLRYCPLSRQATPHPPQLPQDSIGVLIITNTPTDVASYLLRDRYGLSTAEIRLIERLVSGADIKEICQQQNISPNTARTQLKSIFRKTGVNRQAELIKLILTLPTGQQDTNRT